MATLFLRAALLAPSVTTLDLSAAGVPVVCVLLLPHFANLRAGNLLFLLVSFVYESNFGVVLIILVVLSNASPRPEVS